MLWAVFILLALSPYWAWRLIKWVLQNRNSDQAMVRVCQVAIEQCDHYSQTLMLKYDQTVYKNEYGVLELDPFYKELDKFSKSVVFSKIVPGDLVLASKKHDVIDTIQETLLDRLFEYHLTNREESATQEPIEPQPIPEHHKLFEVWCAETLKGQGWECLVTGGPNDQGADIIGTKGGQKLVVQCKKWAQPVGNSAVQEVAAARAHYAADIALVISTSSFTVSAFQLAKTNNVYLVDAVALANMVDSLN